MQGSGRHPTHPRQIVTQVDTTRKDLPKIFLWSLRISSCRTPIRPTMPLIHARMTRALRSPLPPDSLPKRPNRPNPPIKREKYP